MRRNRLFQMTEGCGAMIFDEINKLLNLWDKGIKLSPYFSTVCKQSCYVMSTHACAVESFGSNTNHTIFTTSDANIMTLVHLLDEAMIFPRDPTSERTLTPDFLEPD